jgi:hypothetical protein
MCEVKYWAKKTLSEGTDAQITASWASSVVHIQPDHATQVMSYVTELQISCCAVSGSKNII